MAAPSQQGSHAAHRPSDETRANTANKQIHTVTGRVAYIRAHEPSAIVDDAHASSPHRPMAVYRVPWCASLTQRNRSRTSHHCVEPARLERDREVTGGPHCVEIGAHTRQSDRQNACSWLNQ